MRYWITTQWPEYDIKDSSSHACIWVRENGREIIKQMAIGDYVFIYESKTGPCRYCNGEQFCSPTDKNCRICRAKKGKKGIVELRRICSEVQKNDKFSYFSNRKSDKELWGWYRETDLVNQFGKASPSVEVNKVLGYKSGYNLHGFGQNHSGIREIKNTEYKELLAYAHKVIYQEI